IISAFNSLTLSPALCALILKPHAHGGGHSEALPKAGIAVIGAILAHHFLLAPAAGMFGIALPHGEEAVAADPGHKLLLIGLVLYVLGAIVGYLLSKPVNLVLGGLFKAFNKAFDVAIAAYGKTVALFLRLAVVMLLIYAGLIACTVLGFKVVPTGFIPD